MHGWWRRKETSAPARTRRPAGGLLAGEWVPTPNAPAAGARGGAAGLADSDVTRRPSVSPLHPDDSMQRASGTFEELGLLVRPVDSSY
jgi:hypothetical protein